LTKTDLSNIIIIIITIYFDNNKFSCTTVGTYNQGWAPVLRLSRNREEQIPSARTGPAAVGGSTVEPMPFPAYDSSSQDFWANFAYFLCQTLGKYG